MIKRDKKTGRFVSTKRAVAKKPAAKKTTKAAKAPAKKTTKTTAKKSK